MTEPNPHLDAERCLRILQASLRTMQTPTQGNGAQLLRDQLEAIGSFVQQHRALSEPKVVQP